MQPAGKIRRTILGVDLQALSEFQSRQEQIFSLYMDLRMKDDLLPRFDHLLAEVEDKLHIREGSFESQDQWQEEAERIRRWLRNASRYQSQGLALIGSAADGLWHPFLLPYPVMDQLAVKDQAMLLPILLLAAEAPCALVAIIGDEEARLLRVFLGEGEEIGRARETSGKSLGQSTARQVETFMQEQDCDHLLIGGNGEAVDVLRNALPEPLQERLSIDHVLSFRSLDSEILTQVQAMNEKREEEVEAHFLEELLATPENRAVSVFGVEQVLLAVRGGKARVLAVEADFHRAGGECPNCGFLGEGRQGVCLLCGMALRPEADILAVAMKRVLDTGGEIDVLRSSRYRHALENHGHIGALLREQIHSPHEEETANQRKINSGGEISPDALHDEHVEESFPASDPPGNF